MANSCVKPPGIRRWLASLMLLSAFVFGVTPQSASASPAVEAVGEGASAAVDIAGTVAENAVNIACSGTANTAECIKGYGEQIAEVAGDTGDVLDKIGECTANNSTVPTAVAQCVEKAIDEANGEEEEDEETPQAPQQNPDETIDKVSSALAALFGSYLTNYTGPESSDDSSEDEEEGSVLDAEGTEGETAPSDVEEENSAIDDTDEANTEAMVSFKDTYGPLLKSPATAGAFMGAPRDEESLESNGALRTNSASNTVTKTYAELKILAGEHPNDTRGLVETDGALSYGYFGAALNGLGLDTAAGVGSNVGGNPVDDAFRLAGGNIMLLAYIGSGLIDVIFSMVVSAMQAMNPFNLLKVVVSDTTNPEFSAGMGNGLSEDSPWLGVANFFKTVYEGALNIGWMVTIPLSMAMLVLGFLMWSRRQDSGKGAKRLLLRMAYLVVGLPLLGVTYTAALDSMSGATGKSSSINASRVVLSTYVDFENWANNYRLAIPDGAHIGWDEKTNQPTEESQVNIRKTTLLINGMVNPAFNAIVDTGDRVREGDLGSDVSFISDTMPRYNNANSLKDIFRGKGGYNVNAENNTSTATTTFGETVDLINRYKGNDTISGAGYQASVQAALYNDSLREKAKTNESNNQSKGESVDTWSWIRDWNTVEKLNSKTWQDTHGDPFQLEHDSTARTEIDDSDGNSMGQNPLLFVANDYGLTEDNKPHEKNDGNSNDKTYVFSTKGINETGYDTTCKPENLINSNKTIGAINAVNELNERMGFGGFKLSGMTGGLTCNMSVISLYNYLNTNFTSTEMNVTDSMASTSNNSRAMHASVSAVGAGAMQVVYWFSSMTLLLSFIIIGVGYAMALFFNAIKRSIGLIATVPMAALGIMGAIAKVVVYTVVLFLELFATLFIYRVVQEFMIAIPRLIETPLLGVFGGDDGWDILGGIGAAILEQWSDNKLAVSIIITLISSSGILIFTILAMKLRSTLIGAMDEGATNMINKFLDTSVSSGGNTGGSTMRSMAARGAGMAVGHRLMTGDGDGAAADDQVDTGYSAEQVSNGGDPIFKQASTGVTGLFDDTGAETGVPADGEVQFAQANYAPDDVGETYGAVDPAIENGQDYSVNDQGLVTDSEGQPVVSASGRALEASDIAAHDARGNLVGPDGEVITDSHGTPLTTDDVAGVDAQGNLVGHDGNPLTDASGGVIEASSATQGVDLATDASGGLVDASGTPITDASGNSIAASSIAGFDDQGVALDSQGSPIVDSSGNAVTTDSLGMSPQQAQAVAGTGTGAGVTAAPVGAQMAQRDGAIGAQADTGTQFVQAAHEVQPESQGVKSLGALNSASASGVADGTSRGDTAQTAMVGAAVASMAAQAASGSQQKSNAFGLRDTVAGSSSKGGNRSRPVPSAGGAGAAAMSGVASGMTRSAMFNAKPAGVNPQTGAVPQPGGTSQTGTPQTVNNYHQTSDQRDQRDVRDQRDQRDQRDSDSQRRRSPRVSRDRENPDGVVGDSTLSGEGPTLSV